MTIDLTITMGEDSKIMSLDEARGLYLELSKLFGNERQHEPMHTKRIHEQMNEPVVGTQTERPSPNRNDNHGANPKVEAARNRAAKATSGCGSRR